MSRIREAARRAAEALETRVFFGGDRVQRMRGPATLDVLSRTVRCLVHLDCPEARPERPDVAPLVLARLVDQTRYCTACFQTFSRATIQAADALRSLGLALVTLPEIDYAEAVGAADRREIRGRRPEIPEDVESLAPPPSWLPEFRPR